ncbi:La-related protein 1C [Cardamine amara subsp. amara]|uniref:La-related protein 1C n=1 Tax=Cardamine amara subsp. amara TaxID=228776 RepID=A0ABD0ZB66_CARAN
MESIPSASTISENSGNVETRRACKKPYNGNSEITPIMETFSWPSFSEAHKASSDSLRNVGYVSGTSSSSSVSYQETKNAITTHFLIHAEEVLPERINASASANRNISGQRLSCFPESHLPYPCPREQKQSGNHHPHQSHGGTHNHEHGYQNFNGNGRFTQPSRGIPGFVRNAPPPPPPLMLPIHDQHTLQIHQHFYPFGSPMVLHNSTPPLMFYPPPLRILFIKPSPIFYQAQEAPLKTRIRNQVHYYFSEENLKSDDFMRKRMDDQGFVHIQFIAGFNKLKALTRNIQLILDALQDSNLIELKGYEIRSRHMWRKFLMPLHSRVPFHPSLEDVMVN